MTRVSAVPLPFVMLRSELARVSKQASSAPAARLVDMKRRTPNLFSLSASAFQMGLEAQQVIGLRMAKAALGGPAAHDEAALMVSEKTGALLEAQTAMFGAMMSGAGHLGPARALSIYRRKVRANRRRLLKG